MRILLSHFPHGDAGIERGAAGAAAEVVVQQGRIGAFEPVAADTRASVDAVLHFPPNSNIDGDPADYPRVKAVLRSGVGFDNLDLKAWGARGVPVFNVPDYGTSEVADHAIALMLALTRGTATYHDGLRADPQTNWHHSKAPLVRRLRGQTFGIVGLGRIGLAAALRARAFGLTIAFYDPYLPSGMEIAIGATRCANLAALMGLSDIVSVHAPSSPETVGLIGDEAFGAAKPGLVVINTARGAVVDLDALHDALKSGIVAGAGLDVLPREPADPTHPLIAAWLAREPWLDGRLTLSPHAAFYSPASLIDMRTKGIETLIRCVAHGDLANCVNREFLVRPT